MEENEVVADYFNRVQVVVNQMRTNGESLIKVVIIEKILRTLTQRYNHIMVAIEESKDLDKMKVEDLQGSLEACELRVRERCAATSTSQVQVLQPQDNKKTNQCNMKHKKGKRKFKWYKKYDSDEETGDSDDRSGSSRNQNISDNNNKNSNGKKKFNKKGIQCYNCKKWGHFANECKSKNVQIEDDEAQMAADDSDSDDVLLMTTTNGDHSPFSDKVLLIATTNQERSRKSVKNE
uniref:Uncharacterized protein LOC105853018 n=1 Tax=Cicer arietinum TaxID=3827 RepID=A0A1S3EKI6_CICAR|nr:uncharacterized protein LOC105853018 [Cicer arietinum]